MPSTKVLEAKKEVVSEIEERLASAKSIVLFDYRGLRDEVIKDLRIKLKENDSNYKVYKNTLLKIAFRNQNIDLDSYLEGPTAIAFSQDDVAAVKVLAEVAKKNEALVLKAGLIEGNVADKAKLDEFAKIPSREGLYTMLASGMIGIAKDLAIALNLYAEQKEN